MNTQRPRNQTTLWQHLESLRACKEAMSWIGARTAREAWDQCPRADWLLWWAARTPANTRMQLVRAAAACARTALVFVPDGEDKPRLAIEAAENWAASPSAAAAAYAAASAAYAAAAAAAAAAAHVEMCGLIRGLLVIPWSKPNE